MKIKMKIEIKRWDTNEVIHSGDFEDVRECLEDGVSKEISFCRANLQCADLQGANLQCADLQGVKLQGADLQGVKLQGANFWNADLQGANLQCADLQGADLQGAKLQGANFWSADLQDANFWSADLQGANLQCADLRYAKLQGAKLQGADLRYTKLRGAKLRHANLQDANFDFSVFPLHCNSLSIKNGRRLFVQLCYHLKSFTENEDEDINELLESKIFTKIANKFCEYRTELSEYENGF